MGNAVYLDVNGASYHQSRGYYTEYRGAEKRQIADHASPEERVYSHYKEENPGIGIRYEWGDGPMRNLVMLGEYINSINKQTNYAAIGEKARLWTNGKAYMDGGFNVGAMTGYDDGVRLGVMPMLQFGYGDTSLNLMASPAYKQSPAVLMLNASYRIK